MLPLTKSDIFLFHEEEKIASSPDRVASLMRLVLPGVAIGWGGVMFRFRYKASEKMRIRSNVKPAANAVILYRRKLEV